ncbi:DUF3352 domain-containing protein [Planktothrix agardhii]|uniref:DUF3352 domain-containing protein n=1 Tax=Planktothrix agardhii TaxID=1160 RepID=UPI0020A7B4DD|nr:DUF3352 domain-containing protein [Planktothrix agardhii]CAD5980716.1 hypothetical protein NO758_04624 [Planktothrix agardhii]
MKRRSFPKILVIGLVVLGLLGIGGVYKLSGQNPAALVTGSTKTAPEAAMFVPRTAPAMVSLLVNPDRLESVGKILTFSQKSNNNRIQLNSIKESLLANTGLNYGRDIQPWLGNEITWALITPDLDRLANNGQQPGYFVALSTKNSQKSQEILDKFWQKQVDAGLDIVQDQYRGVKLIYRRPFQGTIDDAPTLVMATINDRFVLFANYPKVMKEALNTVQANLNLSQSESYQKALKELKPGGVGFGFFNLGDWQLVTDQTDEFIGQKPSLALSLGINSQGLLAETVLIATVEEDTTQPSPAFSQPVAALNYISSNSPLLIAGKDLNQLWKDFSAIVAANQPLEEFITQPIDGIKTLWGLDLPQDIFSWVTGEYALAVVPHSNEKWDWVFVAERSENANLAIENLDKIATEQGYSLGSFNLNNNTLSAWTKLTPMVLEKKDKAKTQTRLIQANAKGVHSTVGKYEIFTTSVEAMDEVLGLSKTENLITQDPDFKASIEVLPQINDGYFYLNWLTSRNFLNQQFPLFKLVELSAKPFFDNLRSFTISSSDRVGNIQHATVFLRLR